MDRMVPRSLPPAATPARGPAAALLLALLLFGPPAAAQEAAPVWDAKSAKAAADLAERWMKARPKTCFTDWDASARAALVEEAKKFGPIPEGKLAEIVKILAKAAQKHGPRHGAGGKSAIQTPYGEASFILNGSGRGKGLVIGLHGGGPGAGAASEATKWHAKNCLGMYPQGIQLVHDTWNTVHGERFVLSLIEIAKAQYEIDPDRVYVMGFSMGATGSFHMAGRHPDLFAGAIPAHGVLMAAPQSQVATKEEVASLQHGFLPNVRNLAVWYYTGLEDHNCMPGTFLYANDEIEDLKKRDPGGYEKIRFASYPGLAHAFPPGEPEAGIKYIEVQKRDPFPKVVVWEYVKDPFPLEGAIEGCGRIQKQWFYWLRCERPVDRQYVRAKIEANEITLEVAVMPGPKGLSILLNDRMIDPSKEVVVRVGKTEVWRGRPVPDFQTILESYDARLDTRLTFDRRIDL
ncbi:MAG: dienelactone hydrolase family protein [Planctomycetes bacterium]|nr:dienelactone hydrolase family protein [Planctomycetota bacterium]